MPAKCSTIGSAIIAAIDATKFFPNNGSFISANESPKWPAIFKTKCSAHDATIWCAILAAIFEAHCPAKCSTQCAAIRCTIVAAVFKSYRSTKCEAIKSAIDATNRPAYFSTKYGT